MKPIYLDYAATTPMRNEVSAAMEPHFSVNFGNPGSTHYFGQEAIKLLDEMRVRAADILKTSFRGVVFTGSATEADNLAIRGAADRYMEVNRRDAALPVRIIISGGEHEAIRKTAEALSVTGAEVIILPIQKDGRANAKDLAAAINDRTAVVSIIHTSNETGAINHISTFADIIREKRDDCRRRFGSSYHYPLLHTDAVQGFGTDDINFASLGADLITLSAHKIGGPKGVGILAMAEEFTRNAKTRIINPIITGGDQEFGLRAGTENLPLIVGMVRAMEIAVFEREVERRRLGDFKKRFLEGLREICPKCEINGDFSNSSPHIMNVWFPGEDSERLLTRLDLEGLSVSYGSACKARSFEPSAVITSMYGRERAAASLRFSFGRETTEEEIENALMIMGKVIGS